jgi:hypothetical protein
MFTDQIGNLTTQEDILTQEIALLQSQLESAHTKLNLIRKARRAMEKLQEQFNEQTNIPNE